MSNMQLGNNNTNQGGTIELTSEVINQIRDIVVDTVLLVAGDGSELSVTSKQRDELKELFTVRIQDDEVMITYPTGGLALRRLTDVGSFYEHITNALTNHVWPIEQGIFNKLQDNPELREKTIKIYGIWSMT